MKRTPLKRQGKIGRINQKAIQRLKIIYQKKGIFYCEAQLSVCDELYTTFAHRHSRHWYRGRPELLSDFNQTILCCQACHRMLDDPEAQELKERVFLRLRGKELD